VAILVDGNKLLFNCKIKLIYCSIGLTILKIIFRHVYADAWMFPVTTFSVRVVMSWNSLPEEVISSTTIQAFEARLDKA